MIKQIHYIKDQILTFLPTVDDKYEITVLHAKLIYGLLEALSGHRLSIFNAYKNRFPNGTRRHVSTIKRGFCRIICLTLLALQKTRSLKVTLM